MSNFSVNNSVNRNQSEVKLFPWYFWAGFTVYGAGVIIFTYIYYLSYNPVTDYGIFVQSFHYAAMTGSFSNTLEGIPGQCISHFAIHNSPVLYIVLPFYFLFRSGITLVAVNGLVLWLSVIPLYAVTRLFLASPARIFLCFAFMLTLPVITRYTVQFYEMSFAPMFIILAVYMFIRKRFGLFLLCLNATMAIKEHLFITGLVFAFYSFLDKRSGRWITLPLIVSIIWFMLSFLIILPVARGGSSLTLLTYEYGPKAQSLTSFSAYLVSNPGIILDKLADTGSMRYVFSIFLPLLIIPPFCSRWILMAIPLMFVNIILVRWSMNIFSHYPLDFLPILYIAAADAMGKLVRHPRVRVLGRIKFEYVFCIMVFIIVCTQLSSSGSRKSSFSTERMANIRSAARYIPAGASLASTPELLPYFAERENISYISYKFSPYAFPYGTRYLLYDFNSCHITPPYAKVLRIISSHNEAIPGYKKIYEGTGFHIFEKDKSNPDFFERVGNGKLNEILTVHKNQVEVDSSGLIIESGGDIYVADWDPRTHSWSPRLLLSNGDGKSASPEKCIAGNDAHVVWTYKTGHQNDIYYCKVKLGNNPTGLPVRLTSTVENSVTPKIAIDTRGSVHIVWVEESSHPVIHYKYVDELWGPWCITEQMATGSNPEFILKENVLYVLFNEMDQHGMVRIKNYWASGIPVKTLE